MHGAARNLIDLDLDSAGMQVNALGHTLTSFSYVKCCHLRTLPGETHLLWNQTKVAFTQRTSTYVKAKNVDLRRRAVCEWALCFFFSSVCHSVVYLYVFSLSFVLLASSWIK